MFLQFALVNDVIKSCGYKVTNFKFVGFLEIGYVLY